MCSPDERVWAAADWDRRRSDRTSGIADGNPAACEAERAGHRRPSTVSRRALRRSSNTRSCEMRDVPGSELFAKSPVLILQVSILFNDAVHLLLQLNDPFYQLNVIELLDQYSDVLDDLDTPIVVLASSSWLSAHLPGQRYSSTKSSTVVRRMLSQASVNY